MKKKLVILSGAGVSAESGLKTFRGNDGLWEGYRIEEVATPEAWQRNPELVQRFYNERRRQVLQAQPNGAHEAIHALEKEYEVVVITQNIDDLHERAGSTQVIHLHGIITKAQSGVDASLIYEVEGEELKMNVYCERGSQLRPHVVWFGEPVPMMSVASRICKDADIFVVIGTSLQVYPAAGLINDIPRQVKKYIIDPITPPLPGLTVIPIPETAVKGMQTLCKLLKNND